MILNVIPFLLMLSLAVLLGVAILPERKDRGRR